METPITPERDDTKSLQIQSRSSAEREGSEASVQSDELRKDLEASLEAKTKKWARWCAWTEFRSSTELVNDLIDKFELELQKPASRRKALLKIEQDEVVSWQRKAMSKLGLWSAQLVGLLSLIVGLYTIFCS